MRPTGRETEGNTAAGVAHRQCPYCGHNNRYQPGGPMPGQCDECERNFPEPMESRAAFDSMFGRGRWFKIRRAVESYFTSRRARLVLLGVALGTALGEIGRRLWDS